MAYLRGRYNGVYESSNRRNDVRHYRLVHSAIFWNRCRTKQSRLYNERVYRLHRYWLRWFAYQTLRCKKAGVEDGEINNQRKAFLDMLAWSEGTDNGRQKTRNHGYDVIVGGELLLVLDHPHANLSRAQTQNSNQQSAGHWLSRWDCLPQTAWPERLLSEKVRTLWHCSRLRSVALYLWLIVVISVRQSAVAAISGALAGRWLWSVRA